MRIPVLILSFSCVPATGFTVCPFKGTFRGTGTVAAGRCDVTALRGEGGSSSSSSSTGSSSSGVTSTDEESVVVVVVDSDGADDDGDESESSDTGGEIELSIPIVRKESYFTPPRPENDLIIRAAFGETVERTPVWLFRQAGRHLPEYADYKKETKRNFLQLIANPTDVAECTMQPLRRYNVDAAILFSDILVLAEALQIELRMPGGVGIMVPNPLDDPEEVEHRIFKTELMTAEFVEDFLGHVTFAIEKIRESMEREGKSIPLIGFSAAPYTLLYYMCGGSSKARTHVGMEWLRTHPKESTRLLETLTTLIIEYMSAQVESGAHMLQLFEAMGMMIEEEYFDRFAMPCLRIIARELKGRFPDVPLMVFARGASFANAKLAKLGFDVVTIDGSVDRTTVREEIGDGVSLQGNYDPANLVSGTAESVRSTAKEMLEALGPQRLIANLGEGLGGKENPELVNVFVDAIHAESEAMIQQQQQQQQRASASGG